MKDEALNPYLFNILSWPRLKHIRWETHFLGKNPQSDDHKDSLICKYIKNIMRKNKYERLKQNAKSQSIILKLADLY